MSIENNAGVLRPVNSGESILSRRGATSFSSIEGLSSAQAQVDQFIGRSAELASDPRMVAFGLVGGGLLARFASSASVARLLSAANGASVLESSAAPALLGDLSLFGLRTAPAWRMAPLGAAVLGSTFVLAGCSAEDPMGPPPPEASEINPVGNEFQINTARNTGTNQGMAMAINGSGNLVVAWADYNPSDPTQNGVFARAFDASGSGTSVGVADNPTSTVDVLPSVSTNTAGNFVVSWTNQSDPSSPSSVRARRFDNTGRLIGGTIQVLPPAVRTPEPRSSIVLLDDGGFVSVANDNSTTCGACAYFYNADNSQASSTPLIPAGTTVSTLHVGTSSGGRWTWAVIVATSGGNNEIQFQRYSGRNAQGSIVHHPIGSVPASPLVRVATLPNGNTILAWQTSTGIMAQALSADGAELSDAVQVAPVAPGGSFSLAGDEQGSFVIAWEETVGSSSVIKARVFNGEGDSILSPLDVSGTVGQNREVVVTANGNGRVTIGWRRFSTDGGAHQDLIARNYQIGY